MTERCTASQMCLQRELIQEILAPLFQSVYQLASQNLVVKPTSLQVFPEEVRVNVLDDRSQR